MTPEPELVAVEFAGDCIYQKPYWKPEDVKLFISFCKKSQGEERFKIFGNEYMITPAKLFEFASFYDEQRFHVIESKHLEHKKLEQENLPQPEEIKKYSDQIINKISFLNQKKSGPIPRIKIFDPLNSEKDRLKLFEEIPSFLPEQLDELEEFWIKIRTNYKNKPELLEIITEIIREIQLEQELRRQNVLHVIK